jgi:ABC-type multidrug transport system ATPase subunit
VVTGFLGPNGAGKSTTMRLILGLDAPSSGAVTVACRRYRDLPAPLHEVGALLEARAIHTGRSAANHLLALAHTHGIPRRRVDEVIDLVGLRSVARSAPARSRSAWDSGSGSRRRCSATPPRSCSTSLSTGSIPRGSTGFARGCARSPPRAARSSCRRI